jgi:hypothetical protein
LYTTDKKKERIKTNTVTTINKTNRITRVLIREFAHKSTPVIERKTTDGLSRQNEREYTRMRKEDRKRAIARAHKNEEKVCLVFFVRKKKEVF